MTQVVAKYAAKKLLNGQMEKYKNKESIGHDDPFFTVVPHPRKPGQFKKVKKQVPDYIPEHDALVLAAVRKRAYALDVCLFSFLGLRFGWSSVIGIIPFIGDFMDWYMAWRTYRKCLKIEGGLSKEAQYKMWFNIALDFGIGLVPFIGDLGDAYFKCNTRNLRVLEKELDKKYKPKALAEEHEKLPKHQRPLPASVYEDFEDEQAANARLGPPPNYQSRQSSRREQHGVVRQPEPARVPTERRGEAPQRTGGGGWFSRSRQPDVERGV